VRALLRVQNIEVYYGDAKALFGVSLEVHPGELVALLGSNGAGKTTTLRAIAGIARAASGDIEYQEQSLFDLPAHARADLGMALVPEGRELWPEMTVRENLELGAYNRRAREKSKESLSYVYDVFPKLAERAKQVAGSLSGGEQQMTAIGRALMSSPQLLMLDEPSLGLAPLLVQQLFETIGRLHEEGLTVLLVEQNLTQALEIADRGYVMESGRITTDGTSRELLQDEMIREVYLGL
jgi:branched-chain amino acid transport system ATP-binding protein